MRVIAPVVIRVRPEVRRMRALNVELVGLAVSTLLVIVGVMLAFTATLWRTAEDQSVVALYAIKGPADLEPILTMFDYLDFDEGRDPVTTRAWEK